MLTKEFARQFAKEWIAAWNNHNLEQVLPHYSDDFPMSSPYIATIANEASGTLSGKPAIAAYWRKALELTPNLNFELVATLAGTQSIVLYYKSVRGMAAEGFFFNAEGKVVRAAAHYE
jgi:hypothetical protein